MSSKLISSSFHSTPLNDCFKVGAFERRLGKSMCWCMTCECWLTTSRRDRRQVCGEYHKYQGQVQEGGIGTEFYSDGGDVIQKGIYLIYLCKDEKVDEAEVEWNLK